jgi:transcriptional regulator with XRE-family HTH domain
LYPGVPGDADVFSDRLRHLRKEVAGLSRSQLSRKTTAVNGRGLPEITIKVLETDRTRQPEINTIEVLAAALEVEPETFPEYRLALARRQLDEREVGLAQALSNLDLVERALGR